MRTYLLRLLIFSLVLGALPTVFIGIVSYYIATQDIEEKVNEGNMQLLLQTQMRVEQTLKSLEMSATQLASSSLFNTAMNEPLTPEDFVQVRGLTKELANLQTTTDISQAYLINLEREWAVSLGMLWELPKMPNSSEFRRFAAQPSSIYWHTGTRSEPEVSSMDYPELHASETGDKAGVESVSLVHKIPLLPKTSAPRGLLVLQMTKGEIRSLLTPRNELNSNYILDGTGSAFLSSLEEREAGSEINRQILERSREQGAREGAFTARLGKEEVSVLYRSSGYNGWTYVSLVSMAELAREPKKIAFVTIIACAIILLVVLLIAYFGSRRMYSPIRRLLELTQGMQIPGGGRGESAAAGEAHGAVRAAGDELDYIRESLLSLSVSRTRLEEQMQGQAGHLKEFFVLKLFTGQITDADWMNRSPLYGFPEQWRQLSVLALQIDNLQDTRYEEADRELLLFAVNNIVGELLPAGSRFSPILLDDSQVTLLAMELEQPEELKAALYHIAERIQRTARQYLGLQVSLGISKPFQRLSHTVQAYGESLAALKCRISLGPDMIVHYEDIEQNSGSETAVYSHLQRLEEQLLQALRDAQPDKASAVFQTYLSSVLSRESFLHEHHLLLLQLMSRVLHVVQDQGISIKQVLDGERAVERLLKLQTREEITLWFQSRLFAPIIRLLSDKADSQYINIADRMVVMIHSQYDQDISLEGCAEALNFHPVYLSRVFKKEIGIPFSDYLSEYRMNMAKSFLETTTLKISEIGERLQYKNISAFIRTFRKTFGVTPGQYRESLNK